MSVAGWITSPPRLDRDGDSLAVATAADDLVLSVEKATDFDEDDSYRRWLVIADSDPMEYVSVDFDANTVTLAAAVGAVYEAGLPVTIWDPTVPPAGAKMVEYLAPVDIGRGVIDQVVVPHEKIPLNGIDNLVGASVGLEEDEHGRWYVDAVYGREPVLDGSVIDPATLPTPPPMQGYFTTAPTEADVDYPEGFGWFQYAPNTETGDDDVVGFWRLVGGVWKSGTFVNFDALAANNIVTTVLEGEVITGATVQTRAAERRGIKLLATLDEDTGEVQDAFFIYREDGVPFISAVPATGMAVIAAELKSTSLTNTDGASLGGVTEITRHTDGSAGALRLTAYTTAPKSAPIVDTGYDTVQFDDDGLWEPRQGLTTDGTYWYTARSSGSAYYGEKWTAAGTLLASEIFSGTLSGSVVHAGNLYILARFGGSWVVDRWPTATLGSAGAPGGSAAWTGADGTTNAAAIGVDASTGDLLIAQSRPSNGDKVRVRRYTMTAGVGTLAAGAFVDSDFGYANDLSGITYGTHDFGANRYVFTSRDSGRFQVVDSTGVSVDAERWQSGMTAKVGFTYTGGAFVSMDQGGLMRTYTEQDKAVAIGSAGLQKWVSNTLTNATLETDQSPRARITIPKRTRLYVTTSTINTGGANAPDRVKVYVGKSTTLDTDPGRTAMWKQTDPAAGVTSASYSSLATSGTNPPAANGFVAAGGTVQRLELADGTIVVDGLGSGSPWASWTPTWTGATTNPAIGNGTLVGRYSRLGKTVHFYIEMIAGSTTTFGAGLWSLDLPVAEVARRFTVSGHGFDISANNEYPIVAIRTASDTLNVRCDPVTAGAALRGVAFNQPFTWATGDVLHISGTYEAA